LLKETLTTYPDIVFNQAFKFPVFDSKWRCLMEPNDQVYVRLQKHLNNQTVGFPATRSGVEIKILKHIFTPKEAAIACCLDYKYEPLEKIFKRAGDLVASPEDLAKILEDIQKKGGIESKVRNDKKVYCNVPLVVGMYEYQLDRLTPEFVKNFNKYTSDRKFGIEFLSTELPQMRTIPIAKSIHPQHNVSTFDEVSELLQQAEAPFAIFECICRKKKTIEGKSCKVTERKETCLAIGNMARMALTNGIGREITGEEALAIIEENQRQGLVLQPSNTQKAEFICSCCGCCCGMLTMHRALPRPLDYWASNFYAAVDQETCEGCGACAQSCQVDAVRVSEKEQTAMVDLSRCLGCGVCVPGCPTESITLVKKPVELQPPQTLEEWREIIMAAKKGRLDKMKLTGKLIVDSVRTGHLNRLK
jgi:NAD-dependent dihydropyrimidine dehydrogenase PreA subunit